MADYSISDFRRDIRAPYAWPGGYPRFFITSDGESLSFDSARENRRLILEAIRDRDDSGWRVVACEINWENPDEYCAHSGARIESAYAEDDAPENSAPDQSTI